MSSFSFSLGTEDPCNIVNSVSDGKVAVKDFLSTLEKPLSKEQLRNSATDGEYFSYLSGFFFRVYLFTLTKFLKKEWEYCKFREVVMKLYWYIGHWIVGTFLKSVWIFFFIWRRLTETSNLVHVLKADAHLLGWMVTIIHMIEPYSSSSPTLNSRDRIFLIERASQTSVNLVWVFHKYHLPV